MFAVFENVDMAGLLATAYLEKFTQKTILFGIAVLLQTCHACRRSLFIRRVLELASRKFRVTHDLHNLSRTAQIYLHLAFHNTEYRAKYVHTIACFFNLLPERKPVLSCTLHETRYRAGATRHMDTLISGSGIMHVIAIHFSRSKHTGGSLQTTTSARLQQDSHTFSCGITSLIACVSVVHRHAILPGVVKAEFAQHVTEGILENKQFFPAYSKLYIPCTQLLVLFCPKSFVEQVLDHLIHDLCELLLHKPNARGQCKTTDLCMLTPEPLHNEDVQSRQLQQMNENELFFSIEHIVNRSDVVKTLENYFTFNPCINEMAAAGTALVVESNLEVLPENQNSHLEIPNTNAHTHMNICAMLHSIMRRCGDNITDSEIVSILRYIQHLADAKILGIMSFSVVSLLTTLIFLYSDMQKSFPTISLIHLLELLHDTMSLTGIRLCTDEILDVVTECVVCILAKQQTQMQCATWDAIATLCLQQLTHRWPSKKPFSDNLIESLIVSARHISLVTFKVVLASMKCIFEGFGSVALMGTRRRRQFIDMLKIPLCRGVFAPKNELRQQFEELGVVQYAQAFAVLFCTLDNTNGRCTTPMLSVAHMLFVLALFMGTGYGNKDLVLRLCAKIVTAHNLKDVQRSRVHAMMVELLGRYHSHCFSSQENVQIRMCPILIRHLISTIIPAPANIVYHEIPLQLCIISSLLTHGGLLCLCEQAHGGRGVGVFACNDVYCFCTNVLANTEQMSRTAVHRHGLLLAQRILHRLLRSPWHVSFSLVSPKDRQWLLTHLALLKQLLLEQPKFFPPLAYAEGIVDNQAICSLLQRSNLPLK